MSVSSRIFKAAALFSAAAIAIVSSGCSGDPVKQEIVTSITDQVQFSYETAKAQYMTIEEEAKIPASLDYAQSEAYYAPIDAKVKTNNISKNMKVKKGDVICDLDTYDLDYQIEEKQLYLEKAKLKVDIIYEGGGSQAEIDSAYVDVQLLEKELEKLQAQKEDSSLKSPIDGVVSSLSDVRAGDNVNPGQTIATVIDTSALYIAIQPDDLTQYDIDTEVRIRIGEDYYDGVVFMTPKKLADYQAEQNEDHNNVDDTGIDYQADTIYVRFKDTAPAEAVGQLADTILVLDSVKDAIVISNNLIKKVDGTKVVYVLKNGEKTAVEVETGLSTGSQTEIRSGLNEGDEIVIR